MRYYFLPVVGLILLIPILNSCAQVESKKSTSNDTSLGNSTGKQKSKLTKVDKHRTSVNRDAAKNIQITNVTTEIQSPKGNSKPRFQAKCQATGQCIKLIQHKIISEWNYRRSYPKFKTILVLELSQSGHVSTIKLKRSSGIRAFDDSVISAVLKAEPFTEITYLPPLDLDAFKSIEMVFKR